MVRISDKMKGQHFEDSLLKWTVISLTLLLIQTLLKISHPLILILKATTDLSLDVQKHSCDGCGDSP